MNSQNEQGPLNYVAVTPDGYREGEPYPLVIGLHGFGADKGDLAGVARLLEPARLLHVFPDGPRQAFDGADPTMRAWHERGGNESPEAVREALEVLDAFVRHVVERYRPPAGKAVLWGFSQDGAVSLRYGLPRPELFAGVASLSGSLRRPEELAAGLPAARTQAVFVAHGRADTVVPAEWSRQVVAFLERHGYRPTSHVYPTMGHHISPALLTDFRAWLRRVLPPV